MFFAKMLLVSLAVCTTIIAAQSQTDDPPLPTINICQGFCTRDLRIPISNLKLAPVAHLSYGKPNVVINADVKYPQNTCHNEVITTAQCEDNNNSLKFDVYYPSNVDYSSCKLPAVVMFHSGSFSECSTLNNEIIELCKALALRGFVVFEVEYRRGVIAEPTSINDPNSRTVPGGIPSYIRYTTAQQILAIYRACQDARGFIRSMVKFEANGWGAGNPWHIDVNKLFVGGMSAGSVIALSSVYYQSQTNQWDVIFPNGVSNTNILGPIDRDDYYYAGAETPFPTASILGVLDCWGALQVPATTPYNTNPYAFFSSNANNPPLICFHGKSDSTFNYDKQGVYFSSRHPILGDIFRTESNCLNGGTYQVPGGINDNTADCIALGSQSIYNMFKAQQLFTEIYLDCTMTHGLDDCMNPNRNDCPLGYYDSNFGTPLPTNSTKIYDYIAARAAIFFQTIIGNSGVIPPALLAGDSKFVECENYRNKCSSTADNNAGCNNSDVCP